MGPGPKMTKDGCSSNIMVSYYVGKPMKGGLKNNSFLPALPTSSSIKKLFLVWELSKNVSSFKYDCIIYLLKFHWNEISKRLKNSDLPYLLAVVQKSPLFCLALTKLTTEQNRPLLKKLMVKNVLGRRHWHQKHFLK